MEVSLDELKLILDVVREHVRDDGVENGIMKALETFTYNVAMDTLNSNPKYATKLKKIMSEALDENILSEAEQRGIVKE